MYITICTALWFSATNAQQTAECVIILHVSDECQTDFFPISVERFVNLVVGSKKLNLLENVSFELVGLRCKTNLHKWFSVLRKV
jgi:hypothetical protein